jgi:hypothetical protein
MLSKDDWLKIGKGALIAGAGAGAIYLVQTVGALDFGIYTPAAVALASILVNALRKWMANKP